MTKRNHIAVHVTGLARFDLPADLSREIGRIVVHWAYFEHCIQEMNWTALGVAPAAGRIAVREPRAEDRLEMLRDLVKLRNATWDDAIYKSILKNSKLLKAKRDLVAHGIWHHNHRDGWCVQLTRGSWPKQVSELISGSRKVTPESIPLALTELKAATKAIVDLVGDLKKLRASTVAPAAPAAPAAPSPETHH
jgi:hypothetical protein